MSDCARLIDSAPILVAPTGSGKTIMGVAAAQKIGGRCLWVAHRIELVDQAKRAVAEAGGVGIDVRSIQNVAARGVAEPFDLLVVDECHHAAARSYFGVMSSVPRRLGLTATPFRLDGRGLGAAGFGSIVVAAHAADLCAMGYIVEPDVYTAPPPDVSFVHPHAGDFDRGELARAIDRPTLVADIVETWERRGAGRRSVCFAVSMNHARHIAERFTARGHRVAVVSGSTPTTQRKDSLARLADHAIDIIVNCQLLTEGWDLPSLEVASIARPTMSLNLYLQMVGRVMRAAGEKRATILDHAGNHLRHGAVTQRLAYSLESRVSAAAPRPSAANAESADCVSRSLPTEAVGDLVLATRRDPIPPPFVTVRRPQGTCRVCKSAPARRLPSGKVNSYCDRCKARAEKERGTGQNRKVSFTCPTCGRVFDRTWQTLKRSKKTGALIYCSPQHNPKHTAYQPSAEVA